jgi:hypothetical protein
MLKFQNYGMKNYIFEKVWRGGGIYRIKTKPNQGLDLWLKW